MADRKAGESAGNSRDHAILPITEKQLANLWERRAARSADLRTDKGARVRVLYPGRPGVTAGPDFRDALLLVEGQGLVHGDVEVHLRQRDWRAHRHQHDPNYNGVALHVALEPDAVAAVTHSGLSPPVVGLRSLLDIAADESADGEAAQRLWRMLSQYGYQRPNSAGQMAALLNRAGDERFLSRSVLVRNSLETESPDQLLWEAILRALGYRHNQHAMVELAGAVPIGKLTHAVRDVPPGERIEALQRWLMIWAGFNAGTGRPVWWPPSGLGAPLDKKQWRLFRVRPANHPARRLKGAAALVDRYSGTGLVAGLWRAVSSGVPSRMTESLAVNGWEGEKPAPIGAGRARDIAVNAVLPLLHGWRLASDDAAGAHAMLSLYRGYKRLGENEITRQLASLLQEPCWGRVAKTARQQQGFIHLQRLLAGDARPQLL